MGSDSGIQLEEQKKSKYSKDHILKTLKTIYSNLMTTAQTQKANLHLIGNK